MFVTIAVGTQRPGIDEDQLRVAADGSLKLYAFF